MAAITYSYCDSINGMNTASVLLWVQNQVNISLSSIGLGDSSRRSNVPEQGTSVSHVHKKDARVSCILLVYMALDEPDGCLFPDEHTVSVLVWEDTIPL